MSVSKTIYYAVKFTIPYQCQQITSQSVVTSTTWLNAYNDPIDIRYNFTNLLASPTTTAFETRFSFAADTPDTSLGKNLTNIIDGPTGVWAACNGTATNATGTASGPRRHRSRISTGEAAAIGIGSAAAGALLVAFAACLILRRRLRRRAYSVATLSSSSDCAKDSDKHAATRLTAIPLEGLSSTLPQPEADRTIIANVSKLDTVIKNHAQSFYAHPTTIRPSSDALPLLEKLLRNCADTNAQKLTDMLSNTDARVGGVRFLLAWSILSNIGYNSQVDHTLLSPALAECLSAMNLEKETSADRLVLLSKWRHLTGALMPPSKPMSSDDPRHFNISQLAKDLDNVLRFYASSDDKERFANMTEIIKQGAYVGYVLFVQPTAWAFEWGEEASDELVVFPALVQHSDEHGRPQARPLRSTNVQRVPRGR